MNILERIAKYLGGARTSGTAFGEQQGRKFFDQKKKNEEAKKLAGATKWSSRFFDGYLGLNEKEREQWRKEHEEYENTVARKHPEATELQRDIWRNNKFKQEIIKNLKTPEAKEIQSMLFDSNGKANNHPAWNNIDSFMALMSQDIDFDGVSLKRDDWKEKDWLEKAFGPEGLADAGERTMRDAATKYLDKTNDSVDVKNERQSLFNNLNSNQIDRLGRTRSDRIAEADKLFESVSLDYEMAMNPEKYKLILEYRRFKDAEDIKFESDDEKLEWYAQYLTDLQRGGETYAKRKLSDRFADRMAEHQSAWEMAGNVAIRFGDDINATAIGTLGVIDGLTGRWISRSLGVVGTEEDQKRREGLSYFQGLFDNPWVQYSQNLMETHVYDTDVQREYLKYHLNDAELYETSQQKDNLFSVPKVLGAVGDYGFTVGSTLTPGILSKAGKFLPATAKLFGKLVTSGSKVEKLNKSLKFGTRTKDAVNFFNVGLVSNVEGAQITLDDKIKRYNEDLQNLQSDCAQKMVESNPTYAAAIIQQMGGAENMPSGRLVMNREGGGSVVYSPDEVKQMQEIVNQNPELQRQLAGAYESQHPEEVAAQHQYIKDVVETSAAYEYIFQNLINGGTNITLKKTLQLPGIQRSMARVKQRLGRTKTPGIDKNVELTLENGVWKAKPKQVTRWDITKERLKESAGELLEEYGQNVGSGFGEGFHNAAYEQYINSRYGDDGNINTAFELDLGNALSGALKGMGNAAISDDAIMEGIYGFVSSGIGGFNANQTRKSRKNTGNKDNKSGNKIANAIADALDWLPITWRGAWTPMINPAEANVRNAANERLANDLNAFFSDKEVQEKLNTARGAATFLNQYQKALLAGSEFDSRNARYGSIFSVANMLSKLDGTDYHKALMKSLDIREGFGNMNDEQIKEALTSDEDNEVKKAVIEFKTEPDNITGDASQDRTVNDSQENVDIVHLIAQNAKAMKECISDIGKARKQVEKDFAGTLDEDAMDAMVYQQLSINDKRKRREAIAQELQQAVAFDAEKQANNWSRSAIAKYGNLEVLQANKKEAEDIRDRFLEQLQSNEAEYKSLIEKKKEYEDAVKENGGKENDEIKKKALTPDEQMKIDDFEKAQYNLAIQNAQVRAIEKEEKALERAVNETISRASDSAETTKSTPVLSERDIMEMGAAERAFMLDEKHKLNKDGTNRYSEAQQAVIDKLNEKGRATVTDWDRKIQDAALIQQALIRDTNDQNLIMRNADRLQEFVKNAKITKMERVKTQKWEPLFTAAETAVNNYNENKPLTAQARTDALRELAEFLNGDIEGGNAIDGMVRIKLSRKYGNSRAMQMLKKQEDEIDAFAKTMDNTDTVSYSEQQQADDSSVTAYMRHDKEYKLSDEDSALLTYALVYANNHGMTLDEIPDIVKTEEFQQFVKDKNSQNEQKGRKTKATEVTPDNANLFSNVFRGAIDYHRTLLEKRAKKEEEKQEALDKVQPAKSVTPKEVPVHPGTEAKPAGEDKGKPAQEDDYDYDKELLDEKIQELDRGIQIQLKELLDAVNKMKDIFGTVIDKKVKNDILKKIIELAKTNKYTDIKRLQADLQREYSNKKADNPQRLLSSVVANISVAPVENIPKIGVSGNTLDSQPLEFFLSHEGSPIAEFIINHDMVNNFMKVRDARAKNKDKFGEVAFVYIPTLADAVEESMTKNNLKYDEKTSAPIIIAVPVTIEEAKTLLGETNDEKVKARLIDIGPNNFGYGKEQGVMYLPIGVMPDTNATNIGNASKMAGIREFLDTGISFNDNWDNKGNEKPDEAKAENLPRVLRYKAIDDSTGQPNVYRDGKAKGMPRENGTVIRARIRDLNGSTEDRPSSTTNTARRSAVELGNENIADSERSIVQNIGAKEKEDYKEAKQKAEESNDLSIVRKTEVYKAIRRAFISMLDKTKKTITTLTGDTKDISQLVYLLNKNTKNVYPKAIHIRPISETHHRDKPDRLITKILQEFSESNDNSAEIIGTGNYGDKGANSKLSSLFYVLEKFMNETSDDGILLNWPIKCFNKDTGALRDNRKDELQNAQDSIAKELNDIISSRLSIRKDGKDATIKVEIDPDKPLADKTMTISVMLDNKSIASITLGYGEKFEGKHFMSLLKDLILDESGEVDEQGNPKVRMSGKYEVVKWSVNYQDAVTANTSLTNEQTAKMSQEEIKAFNERKDRATRALEDAYDDDIFTLRLDKLSYIPQNVTIDISTEMKAKIYNTGEPDKKNPPAVAASDAKSGDGTVFDSNSGLPGKTPKDPAPDGNKTLLEKIKEQVDKIIENSKRRILTDDELFYKVGTTLHARVTSMKNFLSGKFLKRYDKNSPWTIPSTSIGNSFDEFARDVFNGIYDGMTDEQLKEAFEDYSNATVDYYMKVYQRIMSWRAELEKDGYQIVKTIDLDGGGIVAAGEITVHLKDGTTLSYPTAGTVDLLIVGPDGKYHIYDFKTYHKDDKFTADVAADNGYDRQLRMYAEFLEKEYGITVDTISIIPCKVNYDSPSELVRYRKKDQGKNSMSNQLEVSTDGGNSFHDFTGAGFEMQSIVPIERRRGEPLEIDPDNMIQEELESVAQALSDRYGRQIRPEDIARPNQPAGADTGGIEIQGEKDSYYDEVVAIVKSGNTISISGLQRRFEIGFNRATELVNTLLKDGVIEPVNRPGSSYSEYKYAGAAEDPNMLTGEQANKLIDEAEAKLEKPVEKKPAAKEKKSAKSVKRRVVPKANRKSELGQKPKQNYEKPDTAKPGSDTNAMDDVIRKDPFNESEKDKHERLCRKPS